MGILYKDKRFASASGLGDIRYRLWYPEEVRGAVQITHGMAEHIERYQLFASFLAEQGFLVYGMDMTGHGKSIAPGKPAGFFGEADGWDNIIQDMARLKEIVSKDYPATPFILMGHSMGSFLARSFAARQGELFDAYIFSGTAGSNPALPIAKLIAEREIKAGRGMKPCAKLDKLSFGAYNKKIKDAKTAFDWLTRDNIIVDKYVQDPLCGFVFTAYGFRDLFAGLSEISDKAWAQRLPKKPILLMSGLCDPVGGNGKGVRQVEKRLTAAGHSVSTKLYEGGRHEMLNELNRNEVYGDVLLYLEAVCAMGELQ